LFEGGFKVGWIHSMFSFGWFWFSVFEAKQTGTSFS
jgi:hypothetical protein